ncbi:hypothetical protein [Cellulomonas oligotrophica]|uniref:Lambda repressor-like predicted transcriptional regulator n=1 Tax=Cellulomonas oligotrophica TaxID=931536 RepID=A0A7Y9FG80_9CELL|nr:hypothetical protein [Cellulomonas oligotrophica]NYD86756.1 lambda repressor-like predicted transcriptional regulator [Cellulomonas oligotrophica]GIG32458.1 hypothetical protein Col01nite_16170 [Cellulomonas oligotrophica]
MSISAVSGSSALLALTQQTRTASAPPPPPPSSGEEGTGTRGVPKHVEAAAEALGMSTDEVVEALEDGSSLADLAQEQGVAREDLVNALVAAAPEDLRALDGIEQMTEQLVDAEGLPGPAGPPPAGSSGVWGASLTSSQEDALASVADLVGVDASTLVDQLRSGTTLADLLSDAGVSLDDLAGALEDGFLIDTQA